MDLVEEVYRLTQTFPNHEIYGLTNQLRRAAVSIPSNIAEGHTREHSKEYLQHLSVAQASLAELETQLEIAVRLKYCTSKQLDPILQQTASLGRQLYALRNALIKKNLALDSRPPAPLKKPTPGPRPLAPSLLIGFFLVVALLTGPFGTARAAGETVVVSLTNPRLENFSNGGAVGLYFSATDLQGQPVGQLSPENIEVSEDGQKVQIVDFRGEEQGRPVDIVVVFDITESMGPFIDGMKEAAIDFADRLAKANRDYRLGLITFEDYIVRQDTVFTRSAREFKSWIGALQVAGGGDIPENSLDALMMASRFPFRPDAQAVVILITDAPNHFRGDGSEKNNPYGREFTQLTADDVLAELKKANLNVFAISPPPFAAPDLYKMAKETGGRHYNVVSEGRRFPELIGEIGRSLASQYFLSYISPRPVEDGTKREVRLTMKYENVEGEAQTAYQVRGVGGARMVAPSPVPGAPPTGGALSYGWWNVVVPLLACAGLLLLAQVRLNQLPTEVLSLLKPATGVAPTAPAPVMPEKPTPYARLIRQSPIEEVPREIALTSEEIVIGRGEECNVIIPHSSISREHACVKKLKPGYVLFDLKSKNGTYVNGRPVVENLLKEGMVVKIGEVEFVYRGAS
jgi:four helix bundle protein